MDYPVGSVRCRTWCVDAFSVAACAGFGGRAVHPWPHSVCCVWSGMVDPARATIPGLGSLWFRRHGFGVEPGAERARPSDAPIF